MDPVIKKRFCTSCQFDRDASTGEYKAYTKTRRWVCRLCIERKSPSLYRNLSEDKHDTKRNH